MKIRLDVALMELGFFSSREKAKANIMAGNVFVNNIKEDKAGKLVDVDEDVVTIKENLNPYVSRGGLKLKKAIEFYNIDLTNNICMDIGASTGGFTDCMLEYGAKKVYAIDVGYGQLDYKLRIDERVVNMEKTNFRHLDDELIKDKIDFASIDVSFISLKLIFPKLVEFLEKDFKIISLVKPQFEAQKEEVGKNGIIKDKNIHKKVLQNVTNYALENSLYPHYITYSPIKGQKGNIEYLLYCDNNNADLLDEESIDDIIEKAWLELN